MIPYIEIAPFKIWGLIVQPFGLLVLTGSVVGFFVARWYADTRGLLRQGHFTALAIWVMVPAFVLSHWTSMILYFPQVLFRDPMSLLDIGASMSSFGGFIGGSIGGLIYLKRHKLLVLEYADALVLGLTIGWLFGRLGCTIVHDHPGIHSDFFLAVRYPDGPRHDLGFYEWLFTICLSGGLLLLIRRGNLSAGTITGIVCVTYAPVRFMCDFLRVADKLYFGFTPGQYFSMVMLPIGILILTHTKR